MCVCFFACLLKIDVIYPGFFLLVIYFIFLVGSLMCPARCLYPVPGLLKKAAMNGNSVRPCNNLFSQNCPRMIQGCVSCTRSTNSCALCPSGKRKLQKIAVGHAGTNRTAFILVSAIFFIACITRPVGGHAQALSPSQLWANASTPAVCGALPYE